MKFFQERSGLGAESAAIALTLRGGAAGGQPSGNLSDMARGTAWILETLDLPLQKLWDLRLNREDWLRSPLFPVVMAVGSYFLICSLYMCLDLLLPRFKSLQSYKVQADRPPTWSMMCQAIRWTAWNNVLLILPASISQYIWVPPTPLPAKAPSMMEFTTHIVFMLVLFDFQYWLWHVMHHRNRWLYRTFHSIHHQYHSTFSWTTQYLHPWELFTVGFFTTVDGWFFECHPLTYWTFMLINVFMSIDSHAGYDFPLFPHKWVPLRFYGGGPKHDMHHMRPLTNFQPYFRSWDILFGWECPGLTGGGIKSEALLQWEEKTKTQRLNRLATQLMGGTENGQLFAPAEKKKDAPVIATTAGHLKQN